jgi:hypothetical protein
MKRMPNLPEYVLEAGIQSKLKEYLMSTLPARKQGAGSALQYTYI